MAGPFIGLALSEPINQVTPFTYRDNATYLTILRHLECKLNELIIYINDAIETGQENTKAALDAMLAYLNSEIARLEALIEMSADDGIVFDPTQGHVKKGTSLVISRTYDNARIYAYFARQLDEQDWTAQEYDDMQILARHFDLAFTYPTLNDVLT